MTLSFSTVVPRPDLVMGVKAVWGRSTEPLMSFGSHGNAVLKDDGYFSPAKDAATKAITQPYLVTIGGGKQVPADLRGRVVEILRVTGVYGETAAFVRDERLKARLQQWPVAVVLLEIYSIVGTPRLIEDLNFSDRSILGNAFSRVLSKPEDVYVLWTRLADYEVEFCRDILPLPGFRDPGKVIRCGTLYPMLKASAIEGKLVYDASRRRERDVSLARAAKEQNRKRHGGLVICEACDVADPDGRVFDVHHLNPLSVGGERQTFVDHLAVLCPTCHRWAHVKGPDLLQPLPIPHLRLLRLPFGPKSQSEP